MKASLLHHGTFAYLSIAMLGCCLVGCVHAIKTLAEFRENAFTKRTFTASMPLREAYDLVAKQTIRCHQRDASQMSMVGGAFFVVPTGSTRVEGNIDEQMGSATISVKFNNLVVDGTLLQVIDFDRAAADQTRVTAYQLNDTKKWTTATASVEGWFSGKTDCFDLW